MFMVIWCVKTLITWNDYNNSNKEIFLEAGRVSFFSCDLENKMGVGAKFQNVTISENHTFPHNSADVTVILDPNSTVCLIVAETNFNLKLIVLHVKWKRAQARLCISLQNTKRRVV